MHPFVSLTPPSSASTSTATLLQLRYTSYTVPSVTDFPNSSEEGNSFREYSASASNRQYKIGGKREETDKGKEKQQAEEEELTTGKRRRRKAQEDTTDDTSDEEPPPRRRKRPRPHHGISFTTYMEVGIILLLLLLGGFFYYTTIQKNSTGGSPTTTGSPASSTGTYTLPGVSKNNIGIGFLPEYVFSFFLLGYRTEKPGSSDSSGQTMTALNSALGIKSSFYGW